MVFGLRIALLRLFSLFSKGFYLMSKINTIAVLKVVIQKLLVVVEISFFYLIESKNNREWSIDFIHQQQALCCTKKIFSLLVSLLISTSFF